MQDLRLTINGKTHSFKADPEMPLLYLLREQLGLNGPKFGCGLEQCGSCMVLFDGVAGPSCKVPIGSLEETAIVTLEGLGTPERLHPVQQAVIEERAAQCGFCTNGMVIAAVSLLRQNPTPSEAQIRQGLERNLCRCGSHTRLIKAVTRASREVES